MLQPFHRWIDAKLCKFRSNLLARHARQLRSLFHVQYSQALHEHCVQISGGDVRTHLENTVWIGMNGVDRWIQRKRIAEAVRWMPNRIDVLDVRSADGALFQQASSLIKSGIGVDVDEPTSMADRSLRIPAWHVPEVLNDSETFDAVVMLAVVEHVPADIRRTWASSIPCLLRMGGRLIITVPAPVVDRILDIGIRLRILHGMEAEQHDGLDPRVIPQEFVSPSIRLLEASRFEFGLNHLLVTNCVRADLTARGLDR